MLTTHNQGRNNNPIKKNFLHKESISEGGIFEGFGGIFFFQLNNRGAESRNDIVHFNLCIFVRF